MAEKISRNRENSRMYEIATLVAGSMATTLSGYYLPDTASASFQFTSANSQFIYNTQSGSFLGSGATASLVFTSQTNAFALTLNDSLSAGASHTHGNLSLTNITGTSASNGLTLSVAAPGAGGGFAAKGYGTYTQNTGTIEWQNSNSFTFGLTDNAMTASFSQSTHDHPYQLTADNSLSLAVGAAASFQYTSANSAFATYNHTHGSGPSITGPVTVTSNSTGWSISISNYLTAAAATDHTHAYVGSLNGSTGTFSISGASNITVSNNASTLTIYGPANILKSFSVGGNTGTTGSSAISGGGFLIAGGSNITLSQNNNSISIHGAAGAAGVGSLNGSQGTMSISGASNITASNNNSTITIYGPSNILNSFSIGGNTGTTGSSAISGGGFIIAGGSNVTLSQNNATISIHAAAGGGATGVTSLNASTGQMSINASQNVSVVNGASTIMINGPANILNSFSVGGNTGTTGSSNISGGGFVLAGGSNVTLSQNNNSISVHAAAGGAGVTLSAWDPYVWVQTNSSLLSHACNSTFFQYIQLPVNVACSKLIFLKSFNALFPGLTSQNSTFNYSFVYSQGVTFFQRSNYAANSSQIYSVATASWRMTHSMSYNNSSHSYRWYYQTDSVGGTTSWSTASQGKNYSSYLTGGKIIQIPFVTTLAPGEYWVAVNQSTTAGASNSAVTMQQMSNILISSHLYGIGFIGLSAGSDQRVFPWGANAGVGNATGTTGTMSLSAILAGNVGPTWYFNFQNLPVTSTPT
jgi:hypothetical protein